MPAHKFRRVIILYLIWLHMWWDAWKLVDLNGHDKVPYEIHDNKYKWLPYVDGLDFLLNMGALVDVKHGLVEVYSGSSLNV